MRHFIDKDYIHALLAEAQTTSASEIDEILTRASLMKGLSHRDVAKLLQIKDEGQRQTMRNLASQVKDKFYGNRLVLFAPLYISDYCKNNCTYCGYRRDNDFARRTLSIEEIIKEVTILEKLGHKRLALEVGEDADHCSMDHIIETIEAIYSQTGIRRLNVNIAATTKENYERLSNADIGTLILFQETYDQARYYEVHPASLKGDYERQLLAHHRAIEGGLHDVGGGVLLGLSDYRFDITALMIHNEELLERFGMEFHTFSLPRLMPAYNVSLDDYPNLISDEQFIDIVAILRLAAPHVGIILSTRESKEMRDYLIQHGVSQISANSKATVGGYSDEEQVSQFSLSDERSLYQTIYDLIADNQLPSYCTACYRRGRVGKVFHEEVSSGRIAKLCKPNAVLTTLEYVLDYGDEAMQKIALPFLIKQVNAIEDDQIRAVAIQFYTRMLQGERDLYL
ncbi:[FeFe] hydrogenase H-cluster radical SAM maturase HydG [Entomospira culicis]|uniref:[FeFe] hydrogenase H-cluster radical SAM maturase HydG n=1 Tax=Entomospira culicis TaxID=2719989 RepID=A0A968GHX0_9SPIO|nr:[FeFe] hydrogenase H-cluster radical SAM maturase HydG [Entomospira culicis]NIZ19069.1 [FeFe] hydrogenase H-cluster radical SAM maturase HydG [Entomospira culicis]NIZ69284.1 [FeFe] hydrogenase H-cluster radical SAM maturase HydG [Entomospira culicis]WDI37869.1 [FeFe] hydrogenase H-cluster radical SAM maturase HydG [Entomospira culicis]WDI39497.1 [FeFe] hydrogenase H-cluster radical SAM maturase HydG [Entomospira culicis]